MIRPIRHQNEAREVFSEEVKKRTCIRSKEENYACNTTVSERDRERCVYVCVHTYIACINTIMHFVYVFTCSCPYMIGSLCVCVHMDIFTKVKCIYM